MAKKSRDNNKRTSKGNSSKKNGKNESRPKHRRVKEIVFDPESRKQYLCGFSERKKQRRAFGLAMQKVKDRKARIEQRAEMKQSMEEQIKEAEERKIQFEQAATAKLIPDLDDNNNDENDSDKEEQQLNDENVSNSEDETDIDESSKKVSKLKIMDAPNVAVYEDAKTKKQWGGDVIVTTTMNFDDLPGDKEQYHKPRQNRRKQQQQSNDTAQEYSGKVERFLRQLKGAMPAKTKKRNDISTKHRSGQHGAAQMPGIGGDANLKAAKKILSRTKSKIPRPIVGKKKKKQR